MNFDYSRNRDLRLTQNVADGELDEVEERTNEVLAEGRTEWADLESGIVVLAEGLDGLLLPRVVGPANRPVVVTADTTEHLKSDDHGPDGYERANKVATSPDVPLRSEEAGVDGV